MAEGQPLWQKQLMKIILTNILKYMKSMNIISTSLSMFTMVVKIILTNILIHMKLYMQKNFQDLVLNSPPGLICH